MGFSSLRSQPSQPQPDAERAARSNGRANRPGSGSFSSHTASARRAADGISAEVIDVATLKPLDFATIAESIAKTGRCVIVHEAAKTAGFGAEIAARCAEECMFDLVAPVERVTGYDTHIPLFRLEMKYLPSVERIVTAAKRAVAVG